MWAVNCARGHLRGAVAERGTSSVHASLCLGCTADRAQEQAWRAARRAAQRLGDWGDLTHSESGALSLDALTTVDVFCCVAESARGRGGKRASENVKRSECEKNK